MVKNILKVLAMNIEVLEQGHHLGIKFCNENDN